MERSCLTRFLPRLPQEALARAIKQCEIEKEKPDALQQEPLQCSVANDLLTIGKTQTPLYRKGNQAKVPDVIFYDNDQVRILNFYLIILPSIGTFYFYFLLSTCVF